MSKLYQIQEEFKEIKLIFEFLFLVHFSVRVLCLIDQ